MSYARRRLDFTFELGEGSFGLTGQSALKRTGLRATAQIELATLPSTGIGQFRIYGLTLSHMNQLSKAGLVWEGRNNKIRVEAGDDKAGMTTVFYGLIIEAYPDMAEAPNAAFVVVATAANDIQLKPVKPISFSGNTNGETALQQILSNSGTGVTLENNGVNARLDAPYFAGSAWDQIKACVRAMNCFGYLDRPRNVLAIWPKDGSRSAAVGTVISPETGMIGYPTFQQTQVKVRTVFSPALKGTTGNQVTVKSQLDAANGKFSVIKVDYNLSSELPGGPWEMIIEATPLH